MDCLMQPSHHHLETVLHQYELHPQTLHQFRQVGRQSAVPENKVVQGPGLIKCL